MFHTCVAKFDVTKNLEYFDVTENRIFCKIFGEVNKAPIPLIWWLMILWHSAALRSPRAFHFWSPIQRARSLPLFEEPALSLSLSQPLSRHPVAFLPASQSQPLGLRTGRAPTPSYARCPGLRRALRQGRAPNQVWSPLPFSSCCGKPSTPNPNLTYFCSDLI